MRRLLRGMLLLPLGLAVFASAALGAGTGGGVPVRVSPGKGGIHTRFVLRFSIPEATGTTGTTGNVSVADSISVSGPSHPGCVGQAEIPMRSAAADTPFKITLNPSRLDGHWCAGRFTGTLLERHTTSCGPPPAPQQIVCPLYVLAPRVIGRFAFRVTQPRKATKTR
jgi:hypothetical protein